MAGEDNLDLAKRWREIMGENKWAGLLNPLDPLLRRELIKYGDFSQCTHIAFDSDLYSYQYGHCKFGIDDFFNHPMMPQVGYKATKLLLSTTSIKKWSKLVLRPVHPDWEQTEIFMGFIAVSDDETTAQLGRRDVCITWRGTVTGTEWNIDIIDNLTHASTKKLPWDDPKVRVASGFLDIYASKDDKIEASARDQVLTEVTRLINEVYPSEEMSITVTGHSLGGALSLLTAYDMTVCKANVRRDGSVVPLCAMTFAAPRLGNWAFNNSVESWGVKVLRVVNVLDPVPKNPGVIFNETLSEKVLEHLDDAGYPWAFTHVGVKLEIDSVISPFLNPKEDKDMNFHDLNTYIHIVDGYQGRGNPFMSETGWDIALINSDTKNLKVDYGVPPEWRIDENKGMVQAPNGRWVHKTKFT